MEWFSINSCMKDCIEKTEALAGLQSQIEKLSKELQPRIGINETFAGDIYKAVYPIIDKRIEELQKETIKKLVEKK